MVRVSGVSEQDAQRAEENRLERIRGYFGDCRKKGLQRRAPRTKQLRNSSRGKRKSAIPMGMDGSDVSQLTGPQQRLHVEISQDIRLFFVCSARLFYNSLFLLVQPPYFDVTGF